MSDVHQAAVTTLYRLLLSSGDGQQMTLSTIYSRVRSSNSHYFRNVNALRDFVQEFNQAFRLGTNLAVTPTTDLGVCQRHSSKSGSCPEDGCGDLHLCIFFLLSGSCVHGDVCLFGHNLGMSHNHRLLWQHRLDGLNLTELRTLFCLPWVRRGVLVPKVCRFYNNGGGCKKKMDCHAMHICEYYFGTRDTRCKFGSNCRRNHDVHNPQVEHVLSLYGFSTRRPVSELLEELRDLHQDSDNNNNSSNSSSYSSDEEPSYGHAQYSGYRSTTPSRWQELLPWDALSLGPRTSQGRQRSASVASHIRQEASLPGWDTRRMSRERVPVSEETFLKQPMTGYSGQVQRLQGVEGNMTGYSGQIQRLQGVEGNMTGYSGQVQRLQGVEGNMTGYSGQVQRLQVVKGTGREARRQQRADPLADTLVRFNPGTVNLPRNLLDIQARPRSHTESSGAPGQGRRRGQPVHDDCWAYPETNISHFSVSNGSQDSCPPHASRSGRHRRN